jgi:hypothetical protein
LCDSWLQSLPPYYTPQKKSGTNPGSKGHENHLHCISVCGADNLSVQGNGKVKARCRR